MFIFECSDPSFLLFMGKDKFENEDLIKWGWPEDVWFHVSNLSSAHVYLRLPKGYTIQNIPDAVLQDALQLVKANSIEGCKKDSVPVVYTPWANLKKTASMEVGQVSFHSDKEVITIKEVTKNNETVKRLKKSKNEVTPNYEEERTARDNKEKKEKRIVAQEAKRKEKEEIDKKREEARGKSYDLMMDTDLMKSNAEYKEANVGVQQYEEDFM
eukprot:c431_g1_i1.p1 GENE.c431_g1_i1~~c431_g1_i1.p1  ORF type:complete len:213 (+),score=93.47 c431_g1_i1:24-662(+)